MDATDIEREIVMKLEKIENNKSVISAVLSENANASGSMNMPRPTQKKVVELMNVVSKLGNNNLNLDKFYSQYKTFGELVESVEETYKTMESKAEDIRKKFQEIQEMYNSATLICDNTEQFDPETVSENSWLDI